MTKRSKVKASLELRGAKGFKLEEASHVTIDEFKVFSAAQFSIILNPKTTVNAPYRVQFPSPPSDDYQT